MVLVLVLGVGVGAAAAAATAAYTFTALTMRLLHLSYCCIMTCMSAVCMISKCVFFSFSFGKYRSFVVVSLNVHMTGGSCAHYAWCCSFVNFNCWN